MTGLVLGSRAPTNRWNPGTSLAFHTFRVNPEVFGLQAILFLVISVPIIILYYSRGNVSYAGPAAMCNVGHARVCSTCRVCKMWKVCRICRNMQYIIPHKLGLHRCTRTLHAGQDRTTPPTAAPASRASRIAARSSRVRPDIVAERWLNSDPDTAPNP